MRRTIVIAVAAFACGSLFGAMNYTLIVGDDGVGFMKKSELTLSGAYYDVREWGALDYLKHPDVAVWMAQRKLKQVASAARELKEDIKQGAKETYQKVKEEAKDVKEGVKEGAKDAGEATKEQYQEIKEKVKDAVNGEGEAATPPAQAAEEPAKE
ncbi:MAG: YtxH domain-containing protein [Nitrospinae bacterium]|nr:YtxH domain-containing protein [Nitrospinota bacterium]